MDLLLLLLLLLLLMGIVVVVKATAPTKEVQHSICDLFICQLIFNLFVFLITVTNLRLFLTMMRKLILAP